MHTYTHQKEILLVVNASFFSRNWVKRNEAEADKRFTQKEKLIDACWNGLVQEILLEFFEMPYDKSMTLWEINDANAFIDLVFCNFIETSEKELSVNPYIFMEFQGYN
jgi:hypothetical protein